MPQSSTIPEFPTRTCPKSSATATKRRQMHLLRRIAELAEYRVDIKCSLDKIGHHLKFDDNTRPERFLNTGNSEILAYDLTTLQIQKHIKHAYLTAKVSACGDIIDCEPAITITQQGIDLVAELERSWWAKAIEKQPITFLQVLIALATIAWTAGFSIYVHYQVEALQRQVNAATSPTTNP